MQDKEYLQKIGEKLREMLPDGHEFILISASRGEATRVNYMASMDRECAFKVMREFMEKVDDDGKFGKHLQ